MPARKPTTVVNVTFQGDEWDYDELVSLGGHRFRLVRVGTSGDAAAAEDLVWRWSLEADAIAVSGIREALAAGHFAGRIEDLQRVKGTTTRVPVRDDAVLTDILQEWAIRRVEAEMPGYFANARVVVIGGTTRERTIAVLREFTDNIIFDGPEHDLLLPGQLKTNPVTATAAGIGEFESGEDLPEIVAGFAGVFHDALGRLAAVGEFKDKRTVKIPLPQLAEKRDPIDRTFARRQMFIAVAVIIVHMQHAEVAGELVNHGAQIL